MLATHALGVTLQDSVVLEGVDLSLSEGEIVGVLGPSGAGKTTLLRAVAGLVDVTGDVTWDNESVVSIPTHKRGFGLMFQGYALFPHLDVAANVGFGLRIAGNTDVAGPVARILEMVGLGGFESRQISSLSGGEKQRVALARTLAPNPKLVMLDEPLGALDRNIRKHLIFDTKRALVERGVTAIVVTHDRDEAVALGDRLVLMRNGQIVQTGALDELLANPSDEWVSEFLS